MGWIFDGGRPEFIDDKKQGEFFVDKKFGGVRTKMDCPTYGTVRGFPAGEIVPYMGQSGFPTCPA
jgi:hypothetical protein